MKFKNLEMTGFKSFSEKTTVLIEKGLTGIVGPNGCGKSNIVEALSTSDFNVLNLRIFPNPADTDFVTITSFTFNCF